MLGYVLLGADLRARLSNFGLSRVKSDEATATADNDQRLASCTLRHFDDQSNESNGDAQWGKDGWWRDDDAQSCTRDNEGTIADSREGVVRGDDAMDSSDLGARWSALTLGAVFVPTIWPKEEHKEEEEEVNQEDARDAAAGDVREVGDDRVFWETCLGKGIQ
ncbi:hypothetical protein QJS10_CPB17g01466 [Acorus calamus]|uniref:Uncharacterized protein n=1 Tax=Acorus calamus TaxID=4465 RepID=A0AAV9CXQ4_ACOCL|nr:hypothetical protein QJS10_CPB17g01466 [Acorus calamus]